MIYKIRIPFSDRITIFPHHRGEKVRVLYLIAKQALRQHQRWHFSINFFIVPLVLIRHSVFVVTIVFVYLKIVLVRGKFQFWDEHAVIRSKLLFFWGLLGRLLWIKGHVDLV